MSFEIIPAIDIINQSVVRLTKGDYNKVEHYKDSPKEWIQNYEQHGAKRIHIVDLDGAKEGCLKNRSVLKTLREATSCELEFGGGIRDKETVQELIDLGVNYIIIGSLLIKDPDLAHDIIQAFPNKIIAGLDATNLQLATDGWCKSSNISVLSFIETLNQLPLSSVIYTDIEKDGMLSGPNLDHLIQLSQKSKLPIIASGGVTTKQDIDAIKTLYDQGIVGCIIGKAILNGQLPLSTLWS